MSGVSYFFSLYIFHLVLVKLCVQRSDLREMKTYHPNEDEAVLSPHNRCKPLCRVHLHENGDTETNYNAAKVGKIIKTFWG